jgi:hypothetical protein
LTGAEGSFSPEGKIVNQRGRKRRKPADKQELGQMIPVRFSRDAEPERPVFDEERIAHSCQDIIGINMPKARLVLRACALLAGFATLHGLLRPADAAACEAELARLNGLLDSA